MSLLRCAVIGAGYLGRFHAQKYKLLPRAELVAVSDVNKARADEVAHELDVLACYDYRELFGKVDAVSIAATTSEHYRIAKDCIKAGIHVLVEKPVTETGQEAKELVELAKYHTVKLQVGHLERFNSARMAIEHYLTTPLFIDCHRLAPFTPRGADVNVILDVMIHDIDLVQSIVKSPLTHIEAHGLPVLTNETDIANVRLTFENQCIANMTASRISFKTERKMRIFQPDSYLSIDYHRREFAVFKKGNGEMFPGIPDVSSEQRSFDNSDALLEEIRAFLECIAHGTAPLVSGEEGYYALETAEKINALIRSNLMVRNVLA